MPPTSATGSPRPTPGAPTPAAPAPGPRVRGAEGLASTSLRRRCTGAEGFTLVEVLVAMSLVALAGLALIELQSLQVRSATALTAATLARIEADNQAIRLLLAPAAPSGTVAGESVNGGVPLRWEASAGPSPAPEAFPDLVTLDIRVTAAAGGAPLASRQIVRPR